LQQTRVETVVPYYQRFLASFPTVRALAEAPSDRVMSHWSGLGYYRRARLLHEAAQQIVATRGGVLPSSAGGLLEIRGIGRYTAGAIASIAFGERTPVVDGNVARVLARLFAVEEDVQRGEGEKRIWALAEALVPAARPGDWNEALMELGATTCVPRAPRCLVCPVRGVCEGRARGIEASLPILRKRSLPSVEHGVALVARVRGAVVLTRRRPGGLFGGLWEPPIVKGFASDGDARRALGALLGRRLSATKLAGVVSHTLSHRQLLTRVLTASFARPPSLSDAPGTYDAIRTVPPAELAALGISTFATKVLALAGVEISGDLIRVPRGAIVAS